MLGNRDTGCEQFAQRCDTVVTSGSQSHHLSVASSKHHHHANQQRITIPLYKVKTRQDKRLFQYGSQEAGLVKYVHRVSNRSADMISTSSSGDILTTICVAVFSNQ